MVPGGPAPGLSPAALSAAPLASHLHSPSPPPPLTSLPAAVSSPSLTNTCPRSPVTSDCQIQRSHFKLPVSRPLRDGPR